MKAEHNQDGWNKHRWRRDTSWWDDLEVPIDELSDRGESVFEWLESIAPDPYEHDFVLYTDGSGCSAGWGGYAAVYERIDLVDELRAPVSQGVVVSSTYGSTVSRSEMNALLDGVHRILSERCAVIQDRTAVDSEFGYRVGTEGALEQISGPERVRILWYTDRENLAKSMLFDASGEPLMSRRKERDLWLRWSFMARHVCLTPMHRPRNSVPGQAVCDALAGIARQRLKDALEQLKEATQNIYPCDQWLTPKPQTAQF